MMFRKGIGLYNSEIAFRLRHPLDLVVNLQNEWSVFELTSSVVSLRW